MNATEQARLSDALYFSGNDGINRRWLCDKVASLESDNAELRKLAAKMARALGVSSEWCNRGCEREFGCGCEPCPLDQALLSLGVEVDE